MKTTNQMNLEIQLKFPFLELASEYTGANNKALIRCNDCGYEWYAVPRSVVSSKHGCPKCKVGKAKIENSLKKFLLKYNKDLYELVNFNNCMDVTVKCKKCGYLRTTNANNIYRFGCPKCGQESTHDHQRLSQEEFISRATKLHAGKYNYDKVEYRNYQEPIIITCPIHGDFAQMPGKHLAKQGCPKCTQSGGEQIVDQILTNLKIPFQREVSIKNPFSDHNFRVDFYIPLDELYIIEYNGLQHYIPIKHYGGEVKLKELKQRDNDLRKYCFENDIHLLLIKYDCKNIEEEIKNFLPCN